MPQKKIADADAKELRHFGALLGIETKGDENKNVMLKKFEQVGFTGEFIAVEEPEAKAAPSGARPSSFRTVKGPRGVDREEVCVNLNVGEGTHGRRPVPVSVNGETMLIPRGKPVWIPVHYEEALRNAKQFTYEESDEGLGEPSETQAYPYSLAIPTQETGAA